jgi:hypothetical protein
MAEIELNMHLAGVFIALVAIIDIAKHNSELLKY